jgi:hypothetical protein
MELATEKPIFNALQELVISSGDQVFANKAFLL